MCKSLSISCKRLYTFSVVIVILILKFLKCYFKAKCGAPVHSSPVAEGGRGAAKTNSIWDEKDWKVEDRMDKSGMDEIV